jgi:hypothetical protein
MCLMEDEDGLPKIKQMMITSEEKYILESLIKLSKSLIIDFMRLILSCFLVCRPSILPNHLHPLTHRSM